jgi:predicted RNase H-like HicB family nuclease
MIEITIKINKTEEGYIAHILELPRSFVQGNSCDDILDKVKTLLKLWDGF